MMGAVRPLARYVAAMSAMNAVGECVSRPVFGLSTPRGASAPPKEIEIALVTKAMDSEFWLVMADGAKAAAAARPGVKLSIVAPGREINIYQQVTILRAWAIVAGYLNTVGLAARDPFRCPMVTALRPR